jgi:hypothetical protein
MEATKRCPYCAEVILAGAIKCKHCLSDLTNDPKALAPNAPAPAPHRPSGLRSVGKLVVGAILFYIACRMGYAIYENNNAEQGSSRPSSTDAATATETPVAPASIYKITAPKLYQKYSENEVAEDAEIGGAVVEIAGKIKSIDKDFLNHAVVNLTTDNEFSSVGLTLDDSQKPRAAQLEKGQGIVIRCEKMTRVLDSPQGQNCLIVQ